MKLRSKTQIAIIDDDIPVDGSGYPLVDVIKLEYGEENVHIFQDTDEGANYIEQNLEKKIIVLLDIMFGGKPAGFEVFDTIVKKSSLVCFILMTGSLERIERSKLVDLINGHAWYFVKRDRPAKEIMNVINKADYYLATRVDGALEEWILRHSQDDLDKPYLKTSDGKVYKLIDILYAIREGHDNTFGQEMVSGILNLTIDLLARNKEQLNKPEQLG